MTMRWLATLLVCVSATAWAAEPTIRIKVMGQQPVVAGQSLRIEVTILAPNFFLSAPAFPSLQVPGAVVTMPDERAANSTESIDGVSYAGISKTYSFTPQTAGDFTLPSPEIRFTYAGDDGKPREASVTLPATTSHAGGQQGTPAQATGVPSTLPAAPIHITQQFDQPLSGKDAHVRAGDALVRTITIFAPGTPAMMIEPPALAAVRGVKQFRADPQLQDGVPATGDEPAGTSGGRRVETITYVFGGSGSFTLPAVSVAWYDPASGKRAQSSAPAVTVKVSRAASGFGLAPTGGAPFSWPDWLDWRLVTGLAALALALGYGAWRWRRGARLLHVRPAGGRGNDRSRLPPLNP